MIEFPRHWHTMLPDDAHFMGRLAAAGIAPPNASSLHYRAQAIEDFSDPIVQQEVTRLATALDEIARIPGVKAAGLAHSQLAVTKEVPVPLKLFLAPLAIRGLETVITISGRKFQCVANSSYLPTPYAGQHRSKEGCFSSMQASAVTQRADSIVLEGFSQHGEDLAGPKLEGFAAVVSQHESDHGDGIRAADKAEFTHWVPRSEVEAYRALNPEDAVLRQTLCPPDQWAAMSTRPDYPWLPTNELQVAFLAGHAAQIASRQ
jgi:peptide deformylase